MTSLFAKSRTRLALLVGLGLLVVLGAVAMRAESGLSRAEQFARLKDWEAVREQLQWYLWLHPSDEAAHLLMARSFSGDNQFDPEGARMAIHHLAQVSEESELAAAAQLDAGRLELLVLQRPHRAEVHFRNAVRLDRDLLEANLLLWKIMELTGRAPHAETEFWNVYELSPERSRIVRLREWYYSQFHPHIANSPIDMALGFLKPGELPSEMSARRRLDRFLAAEPDAPVAGAALASWHALEGDPHAALKLLDETAARVEQAEAHPYFLATLVQVLLDLGEYGRAQTAFDQWPTSQQNHNYWRFRAVLLDDANGDYEQAVTAYDKSLEVWPGPIDWRTRARKANCLARAGQQNQAAAERLRCQEIQSILEGPLESSVRQMLGHLDPSTKLEDVVRLYRQLGLEREAACWEKQIRIYRGQAAPDYAVPLDVPGN